MEIRTAGTKDLERIISLGIEFKHLMLYQKDPAILGQYLPRILVAEENSYAEDSGRKEKEVVGYYHYIVSGDPGFEEMLRCYRQFPERIIQRAVALETLCVCMQGASHREVFREFILYLQKKFSRVWCYCSVKSARPETYTDLGFVFEEEDEHTFFNVSKGGISTYRLGTWEGR